MNAGLWKTRVWFSLRSKGVFVTDMRPNVSVSVKVVAVWLHGGSGGGWESLKMLSKKWCNQSATGDPF
jgi:hypothetical protein